MSAPATSGRRLRPILVAGRAGKAGWAGRTHFRERNPVRIGFVGVLVIVALLFALFNTHAVIVRIRSYHLEAVFSEAGGLKAGDDVRLIGQPVGRVTSVGLDGNTVLVTMNVDRGISLGSGTHAQVKTATTLGVKYVALIPAGSGALASGDRIPLSRTRSAYDITQALDQLAVTASGVDTKELANALDEATSTFTRTPDEFGRALAGVQGLSQAIAERDAQLQAVFHRAAIVSTVLDRRKSQVQKLIDDGSQLATQLTVQRISITQMIANLSSLTTQLQALVNDGQTRLRPALQQLDRLLALLIKNKKSLQSLLSTLAPDARALAESVASGPFFTAYVGNFTPNGFPLFPK